MSNPFDGKFKAFTANLSTKNAQAHAVEVAAQSDEIFEDKPFTAEFQTVYRVAQFGQTISQIVTFSTTAALGIFATMHLVPLWWGIWVAVPIGLLFAFGVERVKRLTLRISCKHFLKYRQFGGVGLVAVLVMCVSIIAALLGANELPSIVYAKPGRSVDASTVEALTNDLNRVQGDIDRTTAKLAQGSNWVAENRTLPRLQRQRAELMEKRAQAAKDANERADIAKAEADAERLASIDKMKVYSVGTAIVAEVVFLLSTAFVFYYLFRHYAESKEASGLVEPGPDTGAKVRYSVAANLATNDNRKTIIVNDARKQAGGEKKECAFCKTPYIYGHKKQLYCSDHCRVSAWEARTGATLKKGMKLNLNNNKA